MGFLLFPSITTVLLFVIIRKARFSWPMACLAFGPFLAIALPNALGSIDESGFILVPGKIFLIAPFLSTVIDLLPLVILAVIPWRQSSGVENNSEVFK